MLRHGLLILPCADRAAQALADGADELDMVINILMMLLIYFPMNNSKIYWKE